MSFFSNGNILPGNEYIPLLASLKLPTCFILANSGCSNNILSAFSNAESIIKSFNIGGLCSLVARLSFFLYLGLYKLDEE